MTALDTIPATFILASSETIPLAFDLTNYLLVSENVQSVAFTMTDLNNGRDFSSTMLVGAASLLAGNQAVQVVTGAYPGHRYALVGTATIGSTKVLSFRLILVADF